MTKKTKDVSNIEIGRRFKELIKEFDGKQDVTAAYLGYSKTSISRFCSGKERLPDAVIEKVAKRWGVREEYIRCKDDYKTRSDEITGVFDKRTLKYEHLTQYMETIGYELHPRYFMICPTEKVEACLSDFLPFIQKDFRNNLLYFAFDVIQYSDPKIFCLENFGEKEIEELVDKKYSWLCVTPEIRTLKKSFFQRIFEYGEEKAFINSIDSSCYLGICYAFYKNENCIFVCSQERLSSTFEIIEKYVKFTIDTFLLH